MKDLFINLDDYVEMPSGLILSQRTAEDYYKESRRPTGIDLFAGAGGFSLGMMTAGFEVVAAVEWDADAAITYMQNLGAYPCRMHFVEETDKERMEKALQKAIFGRGTGIYGSGIDKNGEPCEKIRHPVVSGGGWISSRPKVPGVSNFFFGDARKITGEQILNAIGLRRGETDCVFGGPPCQGFSTSNSKRDVMDPRNSLVFEFARLVCEIMPKTICFENVPGILKMVTPEGIPVMDAFCRILEDGGFGTVDSIKRGLLHSSGAGASFRNTVQNKKGDPETNKILPGQLSLFGDAAA